MNVRWRNVLLLLLLLGLITKVCGNDTFELCVSSFVRVVLRQQRDSRFHRPAKNVVLNTHTICLYCVSCVAGPLVGRAPAHTMWVPQAIAILLNSSFGRRMRIEMHSIPAPSAGQERSTASLNVSELVSCVRL